MKYRILFAGNSEGIVDELFEQLSEDYELMTTSNRYRDMDSHLRVFKPDMYVYALKDDRVEDIRHIAELRSYITNEGVAIAIVGSESECEQFQQITTNMANLVIKTPKTIKSIISEMNDYISRINKKSTEEVNHKHILVIDDDPQMLRVIQEMLKDKYDVAAAISGKIAYRFLEKRTTDLILLDFEMPEENGPQVLTKIREKENLCDIPVLFLTGNTEREKIKEAMSLNPQGYLVKPVDRESLIDSIRKLIG